MNEKSENNLFGKVSDYLEKLEMRKEMIFCTLLLLAMPTGIYGIPKLGEIYQKNQLNKGKITFVEFELIDKNQEKIQIGNLVILDKALENSGFEGEVRIIAFLDRPIDAGKFELNQSSALTFETELSEVQLAKVQNDLSEKGLVFMETNLKTRENEEKRILIIGRKNEKIETEIVNNKF